MLLSRSPRILDRVLVAPKRRRRAVGKHPRARFRPHVELLEDRCLLSAGSLDPTFDGDGRAVVNSSNGEEGWATAIQSDGKIVVAGMSYLYAYPGDFLLTRFNPDGSLDKSFGKGGRVITNFGTDGDGAYGVAIQKIGGIEKIVAVGQAGASFGVARYNLNGTPDTTFDVDGKVTTNFGPSAVAQDVALVDGKIVVVGYVRLQDDFFAGGDFALARYNLNGSLDNSFGVGGKVITDISSNDGKAHGVVIQPDGKIVVAGEGSGDFTIVRYTTSGNLDGGFGVGGMVPTDFALGSDVARDVVLQPDGMIVVAGTTFGVLGQDFAVARYSALGTQDPTFGAGGLVTTDFGSEYDLAFGVALQSTGEIVVSGTTFRGATDHDFAVARYTSTGALDANFGTGGRVATDFGTPNTNARDIALSVAIQANNKIVLAGYNYCVNNTGYFCPSVEDVIAARYESSGGPQLPSLSVGSFWGPEGNSGTRIFYFYVSLSVPSSQLVTVSYSTANGTATAGVDYLAKSGSVLLQPGAVNAEIQITVNGDTIKEGDETFFLNLTSPTNATIADSQGVGTITNDDQSSPGSASNKKSARTSQSASQEEGTILPPIVGNSFFAAPSSVFAPDDLPPWPGSSLTTSIPAPNSQDEKAAAADSLFNQIGSSAEDHSLTDLKLQQDVADEFQDLLENVLLTPLLG